MYMCNKIKNFDSYMRSDINHAFNTWLSLKTFYTICTVWLIYPIIPAHALQRGYNNAVAGLQITGHLLANSTKCYLWTTRNQKLVAHLATRI